MHPRLRSIALLLVTLSLGAAAPHAQTAAAPRPALVAPAPLKVTTPEQFFGHEIGADYVLPNYTKFTEYVPQARRRIRSHDRPEDRQDRRGPRSADGDHHRAGELQEARSLQGDRAPARRWPRASPTIRRAALAKEGKAVVWIDGGLHATEVLGAQQLIETIYQFASKTDEETMRILRDVIILAAHANPDGMELVSDWYMRKPEPEAAQHRRRCRGSTRSTSATTTTATST